MAIICKIKRLINLIKCAAWLGVQLEANWANWTVFILINIIRPLTSMLIITFMFYFVGVKDKYEFLNFFFIGNVLYLFIYNILFGASQVILEDREHYEVIRYIYISPINWYFYIVGRVFARILIAFISAISLFLFGIYFLPLNLKVLSLSNFILLSIVFLFGILSVFAIGIIFCAITLVTARHSNMISESVSGLFFITCGVIYPISVLPVWLQKFSEVIPISYWLEITRRLIFNSNVTIDKTWYNFSSNELIFKLIISSIILNFLGFLFFQYMNLVARSKGLIDKTTSY